ncbi:MAG: TetR/AcrR family transcriptional regulator [Polyangiaceae bacterium]|nr:TetR/AcrR family transcriptional regulator [Polyangiaceae bacterium]
MDERAKRIVETAVALAERDGFAAVRLRDVAASANVALGTVYKRFASKEEILIAALEQESDKLLSRVAKAPPPGETARARVDNLFSTFTRGMCRKPNLARALIRSIASGDPNVTERVASFHAMITALTIAAIRGNAAQASAEWGGDVDREEREIAFLLHHVWFSSLVGWAGGLHEVDTIIAHVKTASKRLLPDSSADA